jgi:hypothetical protein
MRDNTFATKKFSLSQKTRKQKTVFWCVLTKKNKKTKRGKTTDTEETSFFYLSLSLHISPLFTTTTTTP